MSYVCVWSPGWSTGGGPGCDPAVLLEVAPRVAAEERGVIWADARGLPAGRVAEAVLERVGDGSARAGVAGVPVVAEVAARGEGEEGRVRVVGAGGERAFLATKPLALLEPGDRLLALLEGVGVRLCGELAVLEREAVEVRFGAEGVRLWRLSRGDDPRRIFAPVPPERPHASLEFIDYVVTDPERLVFTANALLGSVTEALRRRGEHARRLVLTLSLANGGVWRRTLKPARPTASREAWLRLVRGELERLTLPDAVAGLGVEVEATEEAGVRQGDLFDRGFATAGAVEAALSRLIEGQGEVVVEPELTGHPLPERRARWAAVPLDPAVEGVRGAGGVVAEPRLTLQLLSSPLRVEVEAVERGDHRAPVRFRDRAGWRRVVTAAGPDRISGGWWEEPFAREYFRCITEDGGLFWLYRDGRRDDWYLHGWWD